MTITLSEGKLRIGKDFVDAVAGSAKSHGHCNVGNAKYDWLSTVDCESSYVALRRTAEKEGKKVSNWMGQSL